MPTIWTAIPDSRMRVLRSALFGGSFVEMQVLLQVRILFEVHSFRWVQATMRGSQCGESVEKGIGKATLF